jgi:hypothetical protein
MSKAHGLSEQAIALMVTEIGIAGIKAMQTLLDEIDDDDIRRATQFSALELMMAMALAYWYRGFHAEIRRSSREAAQSIATLAIGLGRVAEEKKL